MDKKTIVRAWKDPEFRASLSAEQRASLPEPPSGRSITELDETDLDGAVGGVIEPTSTVRLSFGLPCRFTRYYYCPRPTLGYGGYGYCPTPTIAL